MIDTTVIASLPKVELHDHLDGGLRPSTIIELAQEIGYELPTTDAEELRTWFYDAANSGDLPTYLTTFDHTTAVMQTYDSLVRVTREAVEDLAADNVVYAELRYAPEQHQRSGLSLQEAVDAVVQGTKEGERLVASQGKTIHVRLILCAMRHADRSLEIAQLTVDNYGPDSPAEGYVVGFDIAGAEFGFPPSNHKEAFDLLRQNLVPFTIHAGEADGVESLRDALAQGTRRIGHGVRVFEDFDATMGGISMGPVAAAMYNQRVCLEICPTSNTQTGIADDIADHPFGLLYDMGFACTVNTDNRLVSGTTMTREFELLAEAFDLEYWQLLELTTTALEFAFCPESLRAEITQELLYPAYNALGLGVGPEAAEHDHEHGHDHDHGSEISGIHQLHAAGGAAENPADLKEMELSMENLKAQLEELGLSLDDEDDDEGTEDTKA